MDRARGPRVDARELGVRGSGSHLLVQLLAGLADRRIDSRRETQVDERGAQVEPAPTDEDRESVRGS